MTPQPPPGNRLLVAQLGARRHYAVPRVCREAGLLEAFHTDFYCPAGLAALLRIVGAVTRRPTIRRLAGRRHAGLRGASITSYPRFARAYRKRGRLARGVSEKSEVWAWGGQAFAEQVAAGGLGRADTMFAFSTAALELFQAARTRGLRTLLDHATAPRAREVALLAEEAERFPGWTEPVAVDEAVRRLDERQARERALADEILCGSTFAASLLDEAASPAARVHVLTLGYEGRTTPSPPAPHANLRVLFAGNEGLRKGVGYLAEALTLLGRPASIEARAVGDLGLSPTGLRALSESLEWVGPRPRAAMEEQFAWADVLVLPSVSDTFGLVLLEAMAHGLPVITTPHSAGPDVIREGVEGFIIPIRNPGALAERLDQLAAHPASCRALGDAAFKRSAAFGMDAYARGLLDVVHQVTER